MDIVNSLFTHIVTALPVSVIAICALALLAQVVGFVLIEDL